MAEEPLKIATDHADRAKLHLEHAKAQYESAKANYESANALLRALESSQKKNIDFNDASSLCRSCTAIPFARIFNNDGTPKPKRLKVGDLLDADERKSNCRMCKFFIEAFQIGNETQSENFASNLSAREAIIYFAQDPDQQPWYRKAGIDTKQPSCSFVWFQTGTETQTGQPHICVTLEHSDVDASTKGEKPQVVRPRKRGPLEASDGTVNYELIESWLERCKSHEGPCRGGVSVNLPAEMYLIDIDHGEVVPREDGMLYVALSYVWGQLGQNQQATRRFQRRLPNRLPRTMQDAIKFAKRLKFRYIWIDYFCIDHSTLAKRLAQINAMDQIFASAYLTLVAVDGPDTEWGLPGMSRPLLQSKQPTVRLKSGRLLATFIYSVWDNNGKAVWDTRGWTLQERLLSKRCIMFAKTAISMQCGTELFHDAIDYGSEAIGKSMSGLKTVPGDDYFREDGSGININQGEWSFETYDALVSVYTGRHLTFQSDALNACRGSLNRIETRTSYQFYYGIPDGDIWRALLWKPHHDHFLTRRSGFPSWSWLGWKGRSEFPYWLVNMTDYVGLNGQVEDRPKKKPRREFERPGPERAQLVGQMTPDSNTLLLETTVATFKMKQIRSHDSKHKNLVFGSQQSKTAVGDHWTILDLEGSPLRDVAGEHESFEPTNVFFRLSPDSSELLRSQDCEAEIIFVHFWPCIRDSLRDQSATAKVYARKHHEWLYNMVSGLLVVRNADGSRQRLAPALLEAETWYGRNPLTRRMALK